MISHELRTPLCGLYAIADMLLATCPQTPKNERRIEMFQQTRRRLLTILETKLVAKAIQTLLETAVKFSNSGETVRLSSQSADSDVVLLIDVRGRNIPAQEMPRFFQVFSIAEPITPSGDLGLGPPLAERTLALSGGGVIAENLDPPGIGSRRVSRPRSPSSGGRRRSPVARADIRRRQRTPLLFRNGTKS